MMSLWLPPNLELCDLATKHKTDKGPRRTVSSPKSYTRYYEEWFHSVRNDPLNLLEIGVGRGASLRMWKEYFPNAKIYGIDMRPTCKQNDEDKIEIFIGNQNDKWFLERVVEEIGGQLHIVIDDGGHRSELHVSSFEVLFPFVISGGLYIIEDLYVTLGFVGFKDVPSKSGSTLDYFKLEVDRLMKNDPQDRGCIEGISFYRPSQLGALMFVQKR